MEKKFYEGLTRLFLNQKKRIQIQKKKNQN